LVTHDLTMKNLMNRISNYESLLKWKEIEPFLKRLIKRAMKNGSRTIVRKRSLSKQGEAPQTVAKSGIEEK